MRTHRHNIGRSHLDIGALPAMAMEVTVSANQRQRKFGSAQSLPEIRRSLATGNKAGRRHLLASGPGRPPSRAPCGHGTNPHEIQPHRIPSTTLTRPTTDGSAGRASKTKRQTHAHTRVTTHCACRCSHPDDTAKHGKDRRCSHMQTVSTVSTMHESGARLAARTGVQPPPGPLGPPPEGLLCLSTYQGIVCAALVSATGRQKLG